MPEGNQDHRRIAMTAPVDLGGVDQGLEARQVAIDFAKLPELLKQNGDAE
jgi:hypothetical protein